MAVLDEDSLRQIGIDPEWHEELLAILLLQKGALERKELRRGIRSIQERKVSCSHPDSAYNYWIASLKKRGIVDERDRVLKLTGLGRWIAGSNLGTISQRNALTSLICPSCSNSALLEFVLCEPLLGTTTVNSKGEARVDVRCPKCGELSQYCNVGGIAKRSEFVHFYNQAVAELGRFVKLEALPI
jgi:hypothetical protein